MSILYRGPEEPAPSHEILVMHELHAHEGRKALAALVAGYEELTLDWLDELHVIVFLRPGGALRLAQ